MKILPQIFSVHIRQCNFNLWDKAYSVDIVAEGMRTGGVYWYELLYNIMFLLF